MEGKGDEIKADVYLGFRAGKVCITPRIAVLPWPRGEGDCPCCSRCSATPSHAPTASARGRKTEGRRFRKRGLLLGTANPRAPSRLVVAQTSLDSQRQKSFCVSPLAVLAMHLLSVCSEGPLRYSQ